MDPWWKAATEFFNEYGLTNHQVSSYNHFMQHKLPKIIETSDLIYTKNTKNYKITFKNVYISQPEIKEPNGVTRPLYPSECRERSLTYNSDITVDIIKTELGERETIVNEFKNVLIGAIPIMLSSKFCLLESAYKNKELHKYNECVKDPGGYFIINGNEKCLLSQDRMAHNEIFILKEKQVSEKQQKKRWVYTALIRSYSETCEPNISSTTIGLSVADQFKGEQHLLFVEFMGLKSFIPLGVLFYALNVPPSEVTKYVCKDTDTEIIEILKPSLYTTVKSQEEALLYITQHVNCSMDKRFDYVKSLIETKLLQNVDTVFLKRHFLGHMVYQILSTFIGRREPDDRDHYGKKRVETSGILMNNLFRSCWKQTLRECKTQMEKKRSMEITTAITSKITTVIKKAFATGNWVINKIAKNSKTGISDLLNRHNLPSTISNLRRLITPGDRNSKVTGPRHLHASHFYYICPSETPEGDSTGLTKNLSLLTNVTLNTSSETIKVWLETLNVDLLSDIDEDTCIQGFTKVFINGVWYAIVSNDNNLVQQLRQLRKELKIDRSVSISENEEGIKIFTDEGRLIAPYFKVIDDNLVSFDHSCNWSQLLENQVVDFLDISEAETLNIAAEPWDVTGKEFSIFHPSYVLGIAASTAPFGNNTQAPRVIYFASMFKQGIGIPSTNFQKRNDTNSHVLCYPQVPLVNTMNAKILGLEDLPTGQNLMVAIKCEGENQEDSVVLCQSAVDAGILRSDCYYTYTEISHKKGTTNVEVKKPELNNVKETWLNGYSKLDEDGMPMERVPLNKRDIVIGKTITTPNGVKDSSVTIKINGMEENSVEKNEDRYIANKTGNAFVDTSIVTQNEEYNKMYIVKTRQHRIPIQGDKVASRSAQKGIISAIVPREDMPYIKDSGITPDLIMNPNAFPSRMTVSQILEAILSQKSTIDGTFGDATSFQQDFDYKKISEDLEKNGFDYFGDSVMIDGRTGEECKCKIFINPVYYQRLKHMVDDKIHYRSKNGPRDILSKQPVVGRKNGGGNRFGNMEVDCATSHGASNFIIDRLVDNSDPYEMYVCEDCGHVAVASKNVCIETKTKSYNYSCVRCNQNVRICKIKVPYAFKLLQQEIMSTGVGMFYKV